MIRRSYNYRQNNGTSGLILSCCQRDLEKGFEAAQRRLCGEATAQYILTIVGGNLFVPRPGNPWPEVVAQA